MKHGFPTASCVACVRRATRTATAKVELAHDASWAAREQARGEVFEYIEQFYGGQRRYSALGYLRAARPR